MKNLTFDIICSLLVGLEQGPRREKLLGCFQEMIEGMWSIPLDMPLTRFRRALKASLKVQDMVKELIHEKTLKLEQNGASSLQELITCLLSIQNKDNNEAIMTEKEIVHNVMLVMVAGYDTSSVLITFIMRFLAKEPAVYEVVLKGINLSLSLFPPERNKGMNLYIHRRNSYSNRKESNGLFFNFCFSIS